MDVVVSILIWFVIGGIGGFILNIILAGIANRQRVLTVVLSIPVSFLRLLLVCILIVKLTYFAMTDRIVIGLVVADFAWGLFMVRWAAKKYGINSWAARNCIGRTVGTTCFALYLFFRF